MDFYTKKAMCIQADKKAQSLNMTREEAVIFDLSQALIEVKGFDLDSMLSLALNDFKVEPKILTNEDLQELEDLKVEHEAIEQEARELFEQNENLWCTAWIFGRENFQELVEDLCYSQDLQYVQVYVDQEDYVEEWIESHDLRNEVARYLDDEKILRDALIGGDLVEYGDLLVTRY